MTSAVLHNASAGSKAQAAFVKLFGLPPLAPTQAQDPRLPLLAFLALLALLLPGAASALSDADMFWHIHTGQQILASGQFPQTDSYSWTAAGQPWIAKEWLSQILYALAFKSAGWTGAALLAVLAASAAYALVFAAVERRAGPAFALAATLCLVLAGNYHLIARPHVLAWPVAILFATQLLEAAEQGRAPKIWLLGIMVLWANLHGSFLLGLALTPFFAWESFSRAQNRKLQLAARWALFGLALACAPLLNPYGPRLYTAALSVLSLGPAMTLIGEWRPQDFSSLNHFEIILLLGLGAGLLTGVKLPASRTMLLLALIHAALSHVRQEFFAIALAALLLAAPVAAVQARIPRLPLDALKGGLVAAFPVLLGVIALLFLQGPLAPQPQFAPVEALAAARAAGLAGPALTEDQFGGYLIMQGVPTYMDSRAELFGLAHYEQTLALGGRKPEKLAEMLGDKRIAWTILPSNQPANAVLAASPDWRPVYSDAIASVFTRVR